ncbi:Glucose-6-phosphate isomerase, cytosolic, partial [Tetrabaena socialis]
MLLLKRDIVQRAPGRDVARRDPHALGAPRGRGADQLSGGSLHAFARAHSWKIIVEGRDVVPDVWEVLDKIQTFTDKVRNGEWLGVTGKPLTSVVAVGIGGSFLGPLFVHTAL